MKSQYNSQQIATSRSSLLELFNGMIDRLFSGMYKFYMYVRGRVGMMQDVVSCREEE